MKGEQRNAHTSTVKEYHKIKAWQEWEDERTLFVIYFV